MLQEHVDKVGRQLVTNTVTTNIDIYSIIYGNDELLERHVPRFLSTLREKCCLDGVNVTLVTRSAKPVTKVVSKAMSSFRVIECPLPIHPSLDENVGITFDWIMENCGGTAPYIMLSHFDIVFNGDFISWVRSHIPAAKMIGRFCDGIIVVEREAYTKCRVGLYPITAYRIARNTPHELRVLALDNPLPVPNAPGIALAMEAGELLEIRMAALGFNHLWFRMEDDYNDIGKMNIFTHLRQGSGHV